MSLLPPTSWCAPALYGMWGMRSRTDAHQRIRMLLVPAAGDTVRPETNGAEATRAYVPKRISADAKPLIVSDSID